MTWILKHFQKTHTYRGSTVVDVRLIGGDHLAQVLLVSGLRRVRPDQPVGEHLPEGDPVGVDVTLGGVGAVEKGLRGRPANGHAVAVVRGVAGHQRRNVGDLHL